MNDLKTLSHTTWNCKYHVVFAPKYRRKIFYAQKRYDIGKILRELCKWKNVNIIEAEACPDHVPMLIEIPPKISVSGFMGVLKGKSSLMIYEHWSNIKYKYRNREFWCKGYYVDTAGKNARIIAEYIKNQKTSDLSDPFTGSKQSFARPGPINAVQASSVIRKLRPFVKNPAFYAGGPFLSIESPAPGAWSQKAYRDEQKTPLLQWRPVWRRVIL